MRNALIVIFGVILPTATLVIEETTGICAGTFFDPIPKLWYMFLVALVPVINLLALLGVQLERRRFRSPLLWLNAVVIGISLVYAILFLPLSLIGIPAVLLYGMGLLPLAPLMSFVCALSLRHALIHGLKEEDDQSESPPAEPRKNTGSLVWGGLLGVLAVVLPELPATWTHLEVASLSSSPPPASERSIWWLRRLGDEEHLLRMCYDDRRNRAAFAKGFLPPVPREEAQKAYFRVTGRPFNAVPPPSRLRALRQMNMWDEFDFDPDLGGQAVAGRRRGLDLIGSQIDGHVYPDAAAAYLQWTLTFQNNRANQREARAQIQLPPGGVVSRLTLWVEGEPREAAFAGTGKVRQAYKKIAVEQRRDPVLVTWAGRDRVMMQCFPVPPNGGRMKVRLGITAPLELLDKEEGLLVLPALAERNFNIRQQQPHSLWFDAKRALETGLADLKAAKPEQGMYTLRGSFSDLALGSPEVAIHVDRAGAPSRTWTADPQHPGRYITQELVKSPTKPLRPIVLVVDGSERMESYAKEVEGALSELSDSEGIEVLVASDQVVSLAVNEPHKDSREAQDLATQLKATLGQGGFDNVPALIEAWESAAADEGGAIIWLHGPQPVVLDPIEPLAQRMQRRPGRILLYDMPVETGPNRILEQLADTGAIRVVTRAGTLKADLRRLLARLTGQSPQWQFRRELHEGKDPPEGTKSSDHIGRLWANGEVEKIVRPGAIGHRDEAIKLAATYQLVTPVSGAVVLETQQQYEENNLKPVDPDSTPKVPNVPEPSTFMLLLSAMMCLIGLRWRRRSR